MTTTVVEQPKCRYCGAVPHDGVCPTVKSIEYHPDGSVKHVEFRDYERVELGDFHYGLTTKPDGGTGE